MRAKYLVVGVVIGVLLSSAVVVLAGSLDPPSGHANAASQMYTLEQLYQRLDTGATDGKMASFTEPSSGPGTGTMHTLDDIMDIAPAPASVHGAQPSEVLSGRTYWGLRTDGTWGNQTGTRAPAPVPKTGQTDCYQSISPWGICTCGSLFCPSGQDGDLEKGIAWPNPRFTDSGHGTVTDNLTGLIWLKTANCAGDKRMWATAFNDVMQLNTDGKMNDHNCGDTSKRGSHQTDWRLPNVRELFSLVDSSNYWPALPDGYSDYFTNIMGGSYWSSTTNASGPGNVWVVLTLDGGVYTADKDLDAWYVWPVRGGP